MEAIAWLIVAPVRRRSYTGIYPSLKEQLIKMHLTYTSFLTLKPMRLEILIPPFLL